MKLTRGGEYGMRGVLYLAHQADGQVSMLAAIAEAQEVPPRFLAKIFQALAKAGIVKSHRGAKGGFSLARPAAEITVKDVVEAIEGPLTLNVCLAGPGECTREKRCSMHAVWEQAQAQLLGVLGRATLADLVQAERDAGAAAAS